MKRNIASGYTPEQDDVLKTLGLAVVAGQGVERLMSTSLTFVLRDEPLVTIEQLEGVLRRHGKATLGQLLRILRERVDLHPTFDERFERFLECRNIIAHRLFDVPGGLDLHTDDGRKNLKTFLLRFMDDGQQLSMIFLGLIRSWSQQAGIDLPSVDDHATQNMLAHVDENVIPQLSTLLRDKVPVAGTD